MATRVNTKFVALLTAVIVLLVGGAAAFWYLKVRDDPEQLIARGNQLMEQGNVQNAVLEYGKALQQRQNDASLILTYVDAMRQRPVESAYEATQAIKQIRSWMNKATTLRPTDHQLLQRYYAMLLTEARRFGNPRTLYKQLHQQASETYNNHDDKPGVARVARKFRGIAQVHMLSSSTSQREQDQTRQDLEHVLEQDPNDAEARYHLARWYLFQAQQARLNSNPDRRQRMQQKAVEVSEPLTEAPEGEEQVPTDWLLKRAMLLLNDELDRVEQATPLVKELEQRFLEDPTPPREAWRVARMVAEVTQAEASGGQRASLEAGLKRMQRLLERAIEQQPKRTSFHLYHGRVLRQQGKVDQAIEALEQALAIEISGDPYKVRRAANMRNSARRRLARVLLAKAHRLDEGADERTAALDRVEGLVEELNKEGASTAVVNRLEGELALLSDNVGKAVDALGQALKQTQDQDPRLTSLAAEAYLRDGQWGEATRLLEQLSAGYQGSDTAQRLRLRLAEIYLRNRQFDTARDHIQTVLEQDPENITALRLKGRMLIVEDKHQQAIEIFRPMVSQYPQVAELLARAYIATDQQDQARKLLQRRLEQRPSDLRSLAFLLHLTDDKQQHQRWLDQAREAGAEPQLVSLVEEAVTSAGNSPSQLRDLRQKLWDQQIARTENPGDQALLRAQLHLRQGDAEKATQVLDEALAQSPDHPDLIRLRFEIALNQSPDSQRAQELAAKAAGLNLDSAGGEVFAGRLALARGDADQAVAALRRAVSAKPVDSRAQRLLGDALRRRGDADAAVEAYQRAIEQRPSNVEARKRLAGIYLQRGTNSRAVDQLRQAYQYEPDSEELRRQYLRVEERYGDQQRALRERREVARQSPDDIRNRSALVELLSEMDRHDEAIDEAQALIEDAGRTRQTVATLAQARGTAGEFEQGEGLIEQYIESRGDSAEASDYLLLARYRLQQGRSDSAMTAYERARELEPEDRPVATREMAGILFRMGQNADAARLYKQLRDQFPDNATFGHRLAQIYLRMGNLDLAASLLNELPDGPTTKSLRGLLAMARGERDQARSLLSASLESQPDQPFILLQRARTLANTPDNLDGKLSDLERAVELAPDLHAARFRLARVHMQLGNREQAISQLRELLSRNTSHRQGRLLLSRLYTATDQEDAARSALEEGQQQFPDQSIWSRRLAQLETQERNAQAAISAWREAVSIEPSVTNLLGLSDLLLRVDRPGQVNTVLQDNSGRLNESPRLQGARAQALARMGERQKALNLFRVALRGATGPTTANGIVDRMRQLWPTERVLEELASVTPQMPRAELGRFAQARVRVLTGEYERGLELLEPLAQALSADEGSQLWTRVKQMQGNCLQQLGEHQPAVQCYEQVLEQRPGNVDAMNNLAYLKADKLDQVDQAIELAQKAADRRPNNAQVLDTLGWAQFKADQLSAARDTLERSIELQPLPHNHLHLGRVHMAMNSVGQARTLLNQAIELADRQNVPAVADQARRWLTELAQATPQQAG